jgi:arsenate reductase
LKKYAGNHYNVYSAGIDPQGMHPLTSKVMREMGIDISDQYPKELKIFLGNTHFDIVIAFCENSEELCPTLPGVAIHLNWKIPDPINFEGSEEAQLNKFREVRNLIAKKVQDFIRQNEITA